MSVLCLSIEKEDSVCVCVYVANYKELIIIERRQKVRAHSSIGQRGEEEGKKRSQSVSNINDEIGTDNNTNACHIHITHLQSEIWLICNDKNPWSLLDLLNKQIFLSYFWFAEIYKTEDFY